MTVNSKTQKSNLVKQTNNTAEVRNFQTHKMNIYVEFWGLSLAQTFSKKWF